MKKQHVKYIKELANRLPVVYQQSISGFYEDVADDGTVSIKPNVFNSEINHVRRMRKAYENLGMEGIKQYLDMIHKIQIQRNETVQNDINSKRKEIRMDDMASGSEVGSDIDTNKTEDTIQDSEGNLGGAGEKRRRVSKKNKQGDGTSKKIS